MMTIFGAMTLPIREQWIQRKSIRRMVAAGCSMRLVLPLATGVKETGVLAVTIGAALRGSAKATNSCAPGSPDGCILRRKRFFSLLPDATPSARKCSTVARSIQWSPDQEIVLSFLGHPPLDKHANLLYTMCFNIAVVDATLKLDSIDAIGYIFGADMASHIVVGDRIC
jgi:hypothetical protein